MVLILIGNDLKVYVTNVVSKGKEKQQIHAPPPNKDLSEFVYLYMYMVSICYCYSGFISFTILSSTQIKHNFWMCLLECFQVRLSFEQVNAINQIIPLCPQYWWASSIHQRPEQNKNRKRRNWLLSLSACLHKLGHRSCPVLCQDLYCQLVLRFGTWLELHN